MCVCLRLATWLSKPVNQTCLKLTKPVFEKSVCNMAGHTETDPYFLYLKCLKVSEACAYLEVLFYKLF